MENINIKIEIIKSFTSEFGFLEEKFEIMDLLANNSPMDYKTIEFLKLPSEANNIVWHPGVYVFIGNNEVFRVGVSMRNSRNRVLQHLDAYTSKNGYGIWDIEKYDDRAILLFNVKNKSDRHWLLSLEAFFETNFNPKIKAGRIG
jgi:hypothetical protein